MINIQKHIISEAFEQLSKSEKLNESNNSKWTDPLKLNDDMTLIPGKTYLTPKKYYYSSIEELEMDGSDSFRDIINLAKRLGWVNKKQWIVIPKGTRLTYLDSDNPGGAGYINFMVNNNQEDVLSFSTDVSEDLDFIVTFKEDTSIADWEDTTDVKFDESVKYPNGELVTDIDLDTYLDYYYGEDRDKDISKYSSRDKQKATDYWFKKHDTPFNESKLTEATIPGYKFDKDDIDMKIKAKDPELHIRLKDAAKLAQYLDSKGIPYKIRNIQDPITKQKLKGFIIHDYFYPKKNKSEKVEESKLTEAPMDVKDYAARLRARKAEKGQNPLEKINSQIDPDMSITDQLQVYFDELVPAQGKADTVAGELVRAMMRVLYRDYNDGDLFYSGYGKETCGGSVVYLMDKVEDLERPFSEIVENQYEDQYYTTELEDAAYLLIQYLNNHPELFTQKNEEDSRNVDENRLDDYFSLPLYEFEPDTSYDESYYAVSDDDIDEFIRGVVSSDLSSGDVNRWARDGWTIVDLDKEDYDTLQELWDRWFRDFLVDYERQEEDEYEDEEDFEESLTKDNQKRGNDMNKVAEDFELNNLDKMGTNEYEANKNRDKHIKMYRKFANITDSEPITEETINEYALNKTATYCNREPERIKAEILGQRYSEYEQE